MAGWMLWREKQVWAVGMVSCLALAKENQMKPVLESKMGRWMLWMEWKEKHVWAIGDGLLFGFSDGKSGKIHAWKGTLEALDGVEGVTSAGEREGFLLGFGDLYVFGFPGGQPRTFHGIGASVTADPLVGPCEKISLDFRVGNSDGVVDGKSRGWTRIVGNLEGESVGRMKHYNRRR